ncbi:hypothetical protein Q1695_004451 [Nippostrongylus brasiliensis]|nr:hypothetical protein Q1695_004451 [Nippostrongylus brasiliensis]
MMGMLSYRGRRPVTRLTRTSVTYFIERASSKICRPSSDRSAQWIYALLMTNVLSVLVAVLACSIVVARTRR